MASEGRAQNRIEGRVVKKASERDQVALLKAGDRTEAFMASSLRGQQSRSSRSHCFMPQNQVTAKNFKVLNVNFMVMTDSAQELEC